jgi:hypothetical protein
LVHNVHALLLSLYNFLSFVILLIVKLFNEDFHD